MVEKDFEIDFKNKKISFNPKGSGGEYDVRELYTFLMDIFDEPENMKYDTPIEATGEGKFRLINGWAVDEEARKQLKGSLET